MKAPITLLALAFTLGLTHPLQCMETPLLSDKLGTLRTNLDTLKKSLSKLKQRLEALKEALKKPSGAGFGGGGPGGGGPGGDGGNGGGTPTSKPLMPFESLPEELNKEIMSFVLESDIKFNFTDSKSLYNSIKAAGRKISTIRLLSKYYAEQYKMSVVMRIVCQLLTKQLKQEHKTLDVPRLKDKVFGSTILDLAIREKNVVICKIILIVDPQVAGPQKQESIVKDDFGNKLGSALEWADPELWAMILETTKRNELTCVVKSFYRYPARFDELLGYIDDSMPLLFTCLEFLINPHDSLSQQAKLKVVNKILEKIRLAKDDERESLLSHFDRVNFEIFYNAVGLDGCSDLLNVLQDVNAITLPVSMNRLLPKIIHFAVKKNNLTFVQKVLDAVGEDNTQTLLVEYFGGYDFLSDLFDSTPGYYKINTLINLDLLRVLFRVGGNEIKNMLLVRAYTVENVLKQAFDDNNLEVVQELLKALGDSAFEIIRQEYGYFRTTALHQAVHKKGNLKIVQALLNAAGDHVQEIIEMQDKDGKTVLHYAVEKGDLKIVQAILSNCSITLGKS